jgi:hypothetical protein
MQRPRPSPWEKQLQSWCCGGSKQRIPVRKDGHFFVFSPGEDAEIVTLEHALKIEVSSEDELD